jgi:hypothetical protein
MPSTSTTPVSAGDAVEVVGHKVGESARHGTIVEVLGEPGHVHYRVAWDDGRESVLYPGSDVRIARVAPKPSSKAKAKAKRG